MALKDWKKTEETNSQIIFQYKKLKYLYVEIDYNNYTPNIWVVDVRTYQDKHIYKKKCDSKSQALKFAKSYMRAH